MIVPINDVQALAFASLFPEMRDDGFSFVCRHVGAGNKIPMLNLSATHMGSIVGLFPCETYPDRIMIHACFLPDYRGEFAVYSANEAFDWIWKHTDYSKISAYIEPEHVKAYAKRCGMVEKNGLFEVSRCQKSLKA